MRIDVVPLGEVAAITAGQSPPGSTYNENGLGLPFFQGKADFGEVSPIARKWCMAPRKVAEAGDILISVRAPVGPTNVAGERCCIGRGLAAVRPDETVVLRDFVHWIIKHREPELIAKGQGSTFAAIGQKDLKSLLIPLLPLDEQRRIVGILDRAAKIERLRKQAAERLREFIPAMFVKMFGDPVENPHAWDVRKLGDLICGFQGGRSIRTGNEGSRFRILRVSAVTDGIFSPYRSKPAPADYVPQQDHLVRTGDLLISRSNTSDLVGATAIVERPAPYVLLPDLIWRFVWRPDSLIEPVYLDSLLKTPPMRAALSAMATGTSGSMKKLSQARLKTLRILIPPLSLQRRFAGIVEAARAIAGAGASSARTAANLLTSLNAELFRNSSSEHGTHVA